MDSLHIDHRLWKTQLNFFTDELRIFSDWLGQVSTANSAMEVKAKVEQFQNRILLQQAAIDKMLLHIRNHESSLSELAKSNTVASDHMLFTDHTGMRTEMSTTVSIQEGLKSEFQRFVGENL